MTVKIVQWGHGESMTLEKWSEDIEVEFMSIVDE